MLFNSLDFLLFFAVVYGVYLMLPHQAQNRWLLAASFFFYGFWDYRFLGLMLISITIDFVVGQRIQDETDPGRKKRWLACSVTAELLILGFFKYFNFFISSAEVLLARFGFDPLRWHLNIVLPVGISFYTFQTMSYSIDIYRGQLKPTRDYFSFALFVSLFPQLVAGPIERASHLLPQVLQPRIITMVGVRQGLWLILYGLFKKMVIADNLAVMVDRHFNGGPAGWAVSLVATYGFAFQILCDFSAYSDIARGVGQLMGFDLMRNFRNPYFALNPSDFWRRWHISLSTWLRDYLYIPLGGNRKGPVRTYINLILTMLLGGLWHGASWTFVIWGLYHGLLLAGHRLVAGERRFEAALSFPARLWRVVVMFHLACIGWVFFRARTVEQAWSVLASFGGASGWSSALLNDVVLLAVLVLPLLALQWFKESTGDLYAPLRLSLIPRVAVYVALVAAILMLGNTGSHAFIYFQF
jgi:D-alanyl-lipoteichoic acid acyltransferase DltB (MBOAT superfamily)